MEVQGRWVALLMSCLPGLVHAAACSAHGVSCVAPPACVVLILSCKPHTMCSPADLDQLARCTHETRLPVAGMPERRWPLGTPHASLVIMLMAMTRRQVPHARPVSQMPLRQALSTIAAASASPSVSTHQVT